METITFQHVFSRVYNYLIEAGIEMTSDRCRLMLELIDDAVAETDHRANSDSWSGSCVLESAMNRIPDYFSVPEVDIPAVSPPLCRGSIGYNRRG